MSDMLTPEEIEALLAGAAGQGDAASQDSPKDEVGMLSSDEKDILGEIGNICMGTAATTMYALLGRRVSITTPRVTVVKTSELLEEYEMPFIVVEVNYVEGIEGNNLMLLKEEDAMLITDLLMGGEGNVAPDAQLNELHLSAISEIMNQMVGSSATSLSQILQFPVNISPPRSTPVNLSDGTLDHMLNNQENIIKISFQMEIENLLQSEIMQVMNLELGNSIVKNMLMQQTEATAEAEAAYNNPEHPPAEQEAPAQQAPATSPPQTQNVPAQTAPQPAAATTQQGQPVQQTAEQQPTAQQPYPQDPYQQAASYPPPYGYPPPYAYPPQQPQQQPQQASQPPRQRVDVQSVQYPSFDALGAVVDPVYVESIGLIMDVPLQVTVELGKSKKNIKEILDFSIGSVIVLDKLAGETVDVMVNGKLIARGEVVVIDENYGVRITDIVSPSRRLNATK